MVFLGVTNKWSLIRPEIWTDCKSFLEVWYMDNRVGWKSKSRKINKPQVDPIDAHTIKTICIFKKCFVSRTSLENCLVNKAPLKVKKNCSVYGVHGIQNDRLKLTASKYEGLVWQPEFWHKLFNISGLIAYFSKPILHWNHELKPVVLSTMNPINETIFFCLLRGSKQIL